MLFRSRQSVRSHAVVSGLGTVQDLNSRFVHSPPSAQEIFDELAFDMLKGFRQVVESAGGRVQIEFASPFQYSPDPKGFETLIGAITTHPSRNDAYRVGIKVLFLSEEIPEDNREKRRFFKAQIHKIYKILLSQYKKAGSPDEEGPNESGAE